MVRWQRLWLGLFLSLLLSAPALHAQTSSPPLALSERAGGNSLPDAVSDGNGGVWLTGYTSGNLPVTADALQPALAGNSSTSDAFVMHLGADGTRLYATYLGGTAGDFGNGIARDSTGNIYVVGHTMSADFPTTAGSVQPSPAGTVLNAFVVKLDPTGRHILYSSYLGGTSGDGATAVAVDATGAAVVVGWTQGFGFPTTWGRCISYTASQNSSFYTRLSADGSHALFSTCLDDSSATAVALDAHGDAWVVGQAGAEFAPRMGSYIGSAPNGGNGFLTKFTANAANPIPISMYVGGDVADTANAVAVTSKGVYIAGYGYSHAYPGGATRPPEPHTATLEDGRQITYEGSTAWVMKVALDGTQVLGTTLINGNGESDRALALQVDPLEVVHVTGDTDSTDFPVTGDAAQPAFGGRVDAWYAQAWMPNNTVGNPAYLTYLGGTTTDRGYALAFDGDGGVWIGGETDSTNFPSVNPKTASTANTFIARYGAVRGTPSNETANVVLYTRDASPVVGNWQLAYDALAANQTRQWNPDQGVPKITTPAASPGSYFEMTFQAPAGVPYHLWLRMKADGDSFQNDSVWVQFSDSVDGNGTPIWRTGTTSGTTVSLEDCAGCGEQDWGWNDNGYGTAGQPVIFATSGTHTIRIQQREDGVSIDQVVLSSTTWSSTAPGAARLDRTIVRQGSTPPPPPANQPPAVAITSPVNGSSSTQSSWLRVQANASDSDGTVARVDFYANSTLVWTAQTSPYHFTWESVPAGTYALTAVATDNSGESTTSAPITVTISPSGGGLPPFFDDADVGDVGATGDATYADGTFTVKGSGADVWGTADAFHYVYENLAHDGAVIAHLSSVSAEANWVKAGVMMRGSLSPDSAQAFMFVSHGKGVCFQRRVSDGGTSTSTCGSMSTAPRWVKLERRADLIAGYESADGATWTMVGSDTFTFPMSGGYAGLAVSSHIRGTSSTATFDHVHVVDAQAGGGACSSLALSRTSFYSGGSASDWAIAVSAPNETCTWTASIDQAWLLLGGQAGPTSITGTGSGTVRLQTVDNRTGAYRNGTFTIGGLTYRVTQEPY